VASTTDNRTVKESDVVAAYTGISTQRTGSTMTTGMTITVSIKVIR